MKILLVVLAGFFLSPVAFEFAAAQTRSSATTETLRVSYGDLDLSTNAGTDRMLRRIRHAAQRVCGVRRGVRPMTEMAAEQSCMNEASDVAVGDVGSAALTARHQRRTLAAVGIIPMLVPTPLIASPG